MNVVKKFVEATTKAIGYIKRMFLKALESKVTKTVILTVAAGAKKIDEITSPLPKAEIWKVLRYILTQAASTGGWAAVFAAGSRMYVKITPWPMVNKAIMLAATIGVSRRVGYVAEGGMAGFLTELETSYSEWMQALGLRSKPIKTSARKTSTRTTTRPATR